MPHMIKARAAIKREKVRKAAARIADHAATRAAKATTHDAAKMVYRTTYNEIMESLDQGRFTL